MLRMDDSDQRKGKTIRVDHFIENYLHDHRKGVYGADVAAGDVAEARPRSGQLLRNDLVPAGDPGCILNFRSIRARRRDGYGSRAAKEQGSE